MPPLNSRTSCSTSTAAVTGDSAYPRSARYRMARLVDPERPDSRPLDRGRRAPCLVGRLAAARAAALARPRQRALEVAGHQAPLVAPAFLGRLDGKLGGRERGDQPAAPGVDRVEPGAVGEER